ncbi:MAG: citramalate synthase [Chloroflexi bacterium]|nr:citramalate synthase [Chloroflexota bacterium]
MGDLPKSVTILDDTMREGLQIEDKNIPVSEKLRLLDALGETGAKTIVIGSFGSPKWCPQMANIDELAELFVPKPGVEYAALTFNPRGVERVQKYYPKIHVSRSTRRTSWELSETFLLRNFNMTTEQQIAGWPVEIKRAKEEGDKVGRIQIGSPWGGNFDGDVSHEQVMKSIAMQMDLWHENGFKVQSIAFSDAMGWNMPHRVRRTLEAVREKWPEVTEFQCHFHDTRGVALASYYEALQLGGRQFSTALGGMGGCPYCGNGRAAGLPPTEDFVVLCEEMGIETGYNVEKLIEAVAVAEEVVGHPLWGHVSKAGPLVRGDKLYPKNLPFVETLEEAAHFRKGPSVCAHQLAPWKEYPDSPVAKALTGRS